MRAIEEPPPITRSLNEREIQKLIIQKVLEQEDSGIKRPIKHVCKLYNFNYIDDVWQKTKTVAYRKLSNMLNRERVLQRRNSMKHELQQEQQKQRRMRRRELKMKNQLTTQQEQLTVLQSVQRHYRSEIQECLNLRER